MNAKDKTPNILIRPLQGEAEARIGAKMMASTEPWITLRRDVAHSQKMLSDPGLEVYVAAAGEEIAGLIGVDMRGSFVGYIRVLVVAPAWRSRGVGAQLIQFAEQRIFRESPNVFLCVSSFNPRAQQFYQRLGYVRIGELKDYVIAGASEFLMRKSIGPRNGFQPRN